jgi:hypothetical protein
MGGCFLEEVKLQRGAGSGVMKLWRGAKDQERMVPGSASGPGRSAARKPHRPEPQGSKVKEEAKKPIRSLTPLIYKTLKV